jgi:hypothetical protein
MVKVLTISKEVLPRDKDLAMKYKSFLEKMKI